MRDIVLPAGVRYLVIAAAILLSVPTVAGASSIVSSLVQGKSPVEAVQILADQIESLTKRVTKLEERQTKTEELTEEQKLKQEEIALSLEESTAELLRLRDQLDETVTGSKQDRLRLRDELSRSISDLTRDRDLLKQQLTISKSDLSTTEKENASLVAKVADLQKKVRCQELITRTPSAGDVRWLGKNIIKFYEYHVQAAAEHKILSETDVKIKKYLQDAADEAKPMYDAYKKECGDYNPN